MGGTATLDPSPSTSSQPVSGGLKEQWGLSDPQLGEVGSSDQAKKFADAFKAAMDPGNKCLQYTVVNAEKAKHDPFVAERDACYSSFQAAQTKIDPEDEPKAKGDIDAVLSAAQAFSAKATQFKEATEKSVNAWKAKEPELDKAVPQIEELEKWEDKMAPDLRKSADGIRTAANDRKYDDAVGMVDQLLANLKPVYEEYLRQKEAKEKYEPALQALESRLGQCAECRFKKLQPTTTDIATIKSQMEAAAQSKDYVKALELVTDLGPKVDAYLAAVKDLEEKKKQYEDALAALQPKLGDTAQSKFKKLEPMQQELTTVKGQMETSAQSEDFEQALIQVNDLTAKVDAYLAAVKDLEEKKKQYEDALAALQPKLGDTAQSKFKKLEPMQQELTTVKGQMETSAQSEDFEQALIQVNDLTAKVEAYLAAVKDLEEKKKQYEDALAALQPKLGDTAQSKFKKLEPMQQELTTVKGQMETSAQSEDFEQALIQVNDLTAKVDAYLAAVKDLEEKKKQYEDALAALQPKLGDTAQSKFKKLEPMQQELTTVKGQMETSAQSEDFEQALIQVNDLTAKVEAYLAAVKDLEEKKKQYEDALAALQPKLGDTAQSKFKKLEPMQQELTTVKGQMETSAQSEDFEQALIQVNDLTAKVDAYLAAVKDLEEKKKQYEDALAALQPKLGDTAQSKFKKLEPMQQELTILKGQMEASAQSEDFEQSLNQVNDLTAKVDAYLAAVKDLEEKKKQYEDALAALQPKLGDTAQSKFKKLEPMQQELTTVKGQMEASAQSEDFEQALTHVNDLTAKVDAYLAAVKDLEEKKKQYEEALAALQPKLGDTAQSKFTKLEPMQQELTILKGQMEASAQSEDFEQSLNQVNDLTAKVDAYLAAVKDLEEKKKQYEDALAALQPKLGDTAQSKFKKLEPMQQELTTIKGQMEASAQSEDFEQALTQVNDLTAKVDAYLAAVKELEEKKKQYEDALEKVKPKLDEAAQKTYEKLASMKQDIDFVKSQMEAAAQSDDFEQALAKVNDLTAKVDAYLNAAKELEEKKKQYEDALEKLKPKLEGIAQSSYTKLAPMKQEIDTLKGQMESAAQSGDYEQALQKANDLTTKVDAYANAAKELEEKKKAYEQGLEALKPKLTEASQSKNADVAQMQKDMLANQQQMEEAVKNGDYEQANKLLGDLKTKVEAILAAKPKEGGGGGTGAGGGGTGDKGGNADGKPTDDPKTPATPKTPEPGKTIFGPITHKFKDIDGPQIPETSKVKGGVKLSAEITAAVVYKGGEEGAVTASSVGGGQVEWEPKLVPEGFKKFCLAHGIDEVKDASTWLLTGKEIEISLGVTFKIWHKDYPWIKGFLTVKAQAIAIEWEKFSKNPKDYVATALAVEGGAEGESLITMADIGFPEYRDYGLQMKVKSAAVASIGPNWPVIFEWLVREGAEQAAKKGAEQVAKKGAEQVAKKGAEQVAKKGAEEVAKRGTQTAEAGAAVVTGEVIIAGSFIVAGVATIGGAIYQIVQGFAIGELSQSYGPNVKAAEDGFKAGMAGGSAPSDKYGNVGFAEGKKNFDALKIKVQKENPNATEDAIKAAIIAKADEALQQAAGAISAAVRKGIWDAYLGEHSTLLLGDNARKAYQACFGQNPDSNHPDEHWKKYMDKFPWQSKASPK